MAWRVGLFGICDSQGWGIVVAIIIFGFKYQFFVEQLNNKIVYART